jgi:hypothetical protein
VPSYGRLPLSKEKVTFSIDKNVIQKARKLDVNLSHITETVLKSFAYSTEGATKEKVYEAYTVLFDILAPLLAEYDATVTVGIIREPTNDPALETTIVLYPDRRLQMEDMYGEYSSIVQDLKSISLLDLLSPMKILENLLDSLYRASELQKKRLEELEMARRIILAIQPSILKSKNQPTSRKSGKSE